MSRAMRGVVDFLRRAVPDAEPTDRELLRRFGSRRDEDAFAMLVHRHGALVQATCQRVLGNAADADDAFQATFLVLARKASSPGWQESIAGWLHEVAYRVASRQRAAASCRRMHERRATPVIPTEPAAEPNLHELRPILDREVSQLPEKYRAPIVLCYLEGKTNEDAARALGWTKGTVSGRLARARDLLRGRLSRQGICLSAAALTTALAAQAASAAVAPTLLTATIRAAVSGTASEVVSSTAAHLAQGVLSAMFWNQVRTVGIRSLIVAAVLLAVGAISYPALRTALAAGSEARTAATLGALAPAPAEAKADAEAAEAIKALIPEASSNSTADWQNLFQPGVQPNLGALKSHSLSVVLLTIEPTNDDKLRKEFHYIPETPNPADLAKAIARSRRKGYGTLLQPDYITDVTCRVKDDAATGTVSFRNDKLYEGTIEYTARRLKEGGWRVEEFRMPAYKIRVTLQADGTWKPMDIVSADTKLERPGQKPPADMGTKVILLRKHAGYGRKGGQTVSEFWVEKDGTFQLDGKKGKLPQEVVAGLIEQVTRANIGDAAEDAGTVDVWWANDKGKYQNKLFTMPRAGDCQKLMRTLADLAAKHADKDK